MAEVGLVTCVDMDSDSFNAVDFLLDNTIDDLVYDQKVRLKYKQPTPSLNLVNKFGRSMRIFQPGWYKKYRWLCGSARRRTMHCYCCLMFSGEEPWCKEGISNVINFDMKARKHSISRTHLRHLEAFHFLGRDRISCYLSPESSTEIYEHNLCVDRNRKVVHRLIDVICHLARQEQPSLDSTEKGSYYETLQLLATEESIIKEHLESNLVTNETLTTTQDDLINSITAVVEEAISKEISEAKFVSIQIDEIVDACCEPGISVIARYHNGLKAVERFLGFYDLSDGSAEDIARVVEAVVKDYGMEEKLVSQTYDSVCLKACELKSVDALIRERYPQTILLHSCSHDINLLLLHCAKSVKDVKLFICNLAAFQYFFDDSTPRCQEIVKEGFNVPSFGQTICDILVLKTVKTHYKGICDAVIRVSESEDWDPESINLAFGVRRILESPSFSFYLCFYCAIFDSIEVFSNVLQNIAVIGIEASLERIQKVKSIVTNLRSEEFINRCLEESSKINQIFVSGDSFKPKTRVLYDIFDSIYLQIDMRFKNFNDVGFVELLNRNNFKSYVGSFPEHQFGKLKNICLQSFNFNALQNELMNIYENSDMFFSYIELFAYIKENELEDIYGQTTRLLQLIFTMPLLPVCNGSAIKRVKTYLRGCMKNKRLAPAATLTIESDFVRTCVKDPSFKNKIVDVFSGHGSLRPELVYKNIYV